MSRLDFDSRYTRERALSSIGSLDWSIFDSSPNIVAGDGYFVDEDLAWLHAVIPRCESIGSLRVVDLGCGHSRLTTALDPGDGRVVGIDFSLEGLRFQSRSHSPVVCADIALLPIRPGTTDFAVSLDALYLCPRAHDALVAVRDVLSNSGRLAFTLYDDGTGRVLGFWLDAATHSGLRLLDLDDTTYRWQPWLVTRHRRRLANHDLLRSIFGDEVAPELSVSRQIVQGALDGFRRYWIACSAPGDEGDESGRVNGCVPDLPTIDS